MTNNIILEGLKKFLQNNVSNKIKLQKPNDKDITKHELVHPSVHIGWIPPKLPEDMKPLEQLPDIPCIIVGMDDGDDDGQEAGLNIRLMYALYNPGKYDETGKYTPNFDGYQDLLNLIDLSKQELAKAAVIEEVTTIQQPFKWGMFQEQPYPYWYGWLTFSVSCAAMEFVPDIAQQYL